MNNAIVTTTIQKPTEATLKFCELSNWDVIVVGDLKTPDEEYKNIKTEKVEKSSGEKLCTCLLYTSDAADE